MARLEVNGTARCPYTHEIREWLEWRRREFVEYDVEVDPEARKLTRNLTGPKCNVPVVVKGGKVLQVGWQRRSCMVDVE